MGDHRANIKIEMEFHGVRDKCDMWINYYPYDCCSMDSRVIEFFKSVYERGMDSFSDFVEEAKKDREEKEERLQYARLKEKFEGKP